MFDMRILVFFWDLFYVLMFTWVDVLLFSRLTSMVDVYLYRCGQGRDD